MRSIRGTSVAKLSPFITQIKFIMVHIRVFWLKYAKQRQVSDGKKILISRA